MYNHKPSLMANIGREGGIIPKKCCPDIFSIFDGYHEVWTIGMCSLGDGTILYQKQVYATHIV